MMRRSTQYAEAFITSDPSSRQARQALEKIIDFVHRELS